MEASRHQFLKKATRKKLIAESADILRQIREELPPNLAEMEYFYERLQAWSEGKIVHEKPLIGTFCIQVPEELIFALDAQFERLCDGSRACDLTGMERLGGKSCSMIKASLGRLDALAEPTDYAAIIIPTTCDQKKKLGDILKAQGFPILFLNMPSGKMDDAARHFWHQSVQELATQLQKILNVKLTTSKLLEQVKIIGRARQAFRHFEQLRARKRAIHGVDALIISSTWFFDTPQNWTQALLKLNAALAKQPDHQGQEPRILLTGSPNIFPNLKTPLLAEKAGAWIVGDEFCSSHRLLHDVVTFEEGHPHDLLPAIADRYLKPCTCPCLSDNEDRIRKLSYLASNLQLDGVIYQSLSGCSLYEMEYLVVEPQLKTQKLPNLYLETDYGPDDVGQITTRIEAFLESLYQQRNTKQ